MEPHDCNFRDELRVCINDRCPLHRGMRTIAENLRIGAALNAAEDIGRRRCNDSWSRPNWQSTGCGREAP
jgi:hypothetical protein